MPRPKKNKQAGAAFKELLNQKGFSNYKLSKATGIGRGHIGRIVSGETANPEPTTLGKIATALGIELGELTQIFDQSPVRSHSAAVPQPQEPAQEETAPKSPDFVGREEAIAESTPDNELDELVRRVREKRYRKIQDQCGTLRILDVEQEIEIDDLYIDVNVLEEIPSFKHKGFPELLEDLNLDEIHRIGFGRHQERLPGLKAVEKYRKLMMLGQPGAGKTTFLQHIAIECNQGRFQASCVPIFIRLREFTENAKDIGDFRLFNYINHEFACCRISAPQQMLTKLLHDGRALILLDGLDEVPEQDREEVLKQIRRFASDYYSNQFIITCRIAEGQSRFKNFTNVEIADFTPEQIEKFAKKWFVSLAQKSNRDEKEGFQKATKLMEKLDENERILELAVTPLLLTFICLVFQHGDELPAKRSELYEKGMNILLNKWDRDRGIKRDEIYQNLSPYHKIKLLSHVASATFDQSPYYLFEQRTVQGYIADYLGALPDADPDSEQLFHDSEAVLQAIGAQHGLLTAQAQGIYSFSHRTFQEYFTARQIVLSSNPQVLENWVSHITEKRWDEVFELVAEMFHFSPIQDYLLFLMKQRIDSLLATDEKLQGFLRWVSQKTSSVKASCKAAAIRAFFFFIEGSNRKASSLNFIDDFELALALDPNFGLTLECNLVLVLDGEQCEFDPDLVLDRYLAFALAFERHFNSCINRSIDTESDFSHYFKSITDSNERAAVASRLAARTRKINRLLASQLVNELFIAVKGAYYILIFIFRLSSELVQSLQQLADQIPDTKDEKRFHELWKANCQEWTKQLRIVTIKHRNLGHEWQFNKEEKELLQQYYDANKLLLNCMNNACKVSTEVRSHIEDTLLLPIAEIREIERQRGIK